MSIMKENLHTKYTPFTYNDVTLNKMLPITKQNLCIFFFIIGRVECIYKKVESGDVINISTLKQEIDQDQKLNKLDDRSGDINPYRE